MAPVVILGASGHAKVIIRILEEMHDWDIIGCTSAGRGAEEPLGCPVLGGDDVLPGLLASGVRHAFVAIGDNRVRRRVSEEVRQVGFTLINAISPRALISPGVQLGCGVAVMAGAVIQADALVGDGAIVNTGATVDHDCRVGPYAHIAPGVNLAGRVKVGEGAFLGIGSCVVPGIRIGPWAVVGAGAAVIEDVPEAVTVVGVPARVTERRTPLAGL
jgi:UDP-perosamine 4-acetyltransferase